MKKATLFLFLLFSIMQACAQSRVVAQVSNFESNKGLCRACIFNNKSSFNGEGGKPLQCVTGGIQNGQASISFTNIPPGIYAVFLFHDTNNNNRMDKNFLGIPKEGYGSSKNRLPFAAAPGFEDNKFSVAPNSIVRLNIKLRNL